MRETRIASRAKEEGRTEWKREVLSRLSGAPSNYEVPSKKKGDIRMSKLEVSELAIEKSPYLCKRRMAMEEGRAHLEVHSPAC